MTMLHRDRRRFADGTRRATYEGLPRIIKASKPANARLNMDLYKLIRVADAFRLGDSVLRGFTEALEKNPDLKLPFVAPGLGTASGNHWTIVDMASDWNAVFLFQHAATGTG